MSLSAAQDTPLPSPWMWNQLRQENTRLHQHKDPWWGRFGERPQNTKHFSEIGKNQIWFYQRNASLNLCPDSARIHHHKQDWFIYWQTNIWRECLDANGTKISLLFLFFSFLFPYIDFLYHEMTAKEITGATSTDAAGAKPALSPEWECPWVDVPDISMCRYTVLRDRSKLYWPAGRGILLKSRFLHWLEFYTKANGCCPTRMACCPKNHLHCLVLNWVTTTSVTVPPRLHHPKTCQHLTDLTSHLLSYWKDSVLCMHFDAKYFSRHTK